MFNDRVRFEQVHVQVMEEMDEYTYIEPHTETNTSIEKEMRRYSGIFRGSLPLCLKRKAFKQCVLPVMAYGPETWTKNMLLERKQIIPRQEWKD